MNNPNPLIPQGSLADQKNQGRARVKIAVFVVLAIHGIGLLALLMQGCNKPPEPGTAPGGQTNTNVAPAFLEPTNPPVVEGLTPGGTNPPAVTEPAVTPPSATDYKIVQGDTFSTIARKFHVSVKAIQDANPGVESTRLKIGQTLRIPAPVSTGAAVGGAGTLSAQADSSSGQQIYTVKSGDTLTKIATEFSTTVRALRSANSLTTDKIKVGDKLKIPVKSASSTAPTEPSPAGSASTSAPAGTAPGHQ